MSKFEVGDSAYYWYMGSTILDLECMPVQSELQAENFSFRKGYFNSKKQALDSMYKRLHAIEEGLQ